MSTSTIAEAHRASRRLHDDNTGQLRDEPALPAPMWRRADGPCGAPRPQDRRHHQSRYRTCPGRLLIAGLTIAGRIVTADLPLNNRQAGHQRGATAYLDDIPREPNPFISHLLNLA